MATKLQELLEELKELKKFYIEADCDGNFDLIETGRQDLIKTPELFIRNFELDQLITKYTETTPTYKPGDSVRVVKQLHGHQFIISSIITLKIKESGDDRYWECYNDTNTWYLMEEEFEPIN